LIRLTPAWRAKGLLGESFLEPCGHEKGPLRNILRIREEHNRRLLEEGCSTIERLLIERGIL
jgi:hypothetical protein